jgi:hypothetical protein
MKGLGAALLMLAVILAPTADAQKIRSAEQGSVPLVLDPFTHERSVVTVKPGDTAWTEAVRPTKVVRLVDAAPPRIRPGNIDGVPAGAILFGYRLSTGFAYCPQIDTARPNTRVQCFRDLDGDGTFDGGYVTNDTSADSRYFSSFLQGLVSVAKRRYEPAASADLPPAPVRVVYAGLKKGAPRFNLFMETDKMDTTLDCVIQHPGVCDVLGVRIAFAATAEPKDAVTLAFEGAAQNRTFDVYDPNNHLQR